MTPSLDPPADAAPMPAPRGWREDGPRFALVAWVIGAIVMGMMAVGASITVSVIAVVRARLGGERSADRFREIAERAVASDAAAWVQVIASQAALLACAWFACRVLRQPVRERLGLVATGLTRLQCAVVLFATAIPFALGLVAAGLLEKVVGPSGDDAVGLQRMWSEGSRGASVAWILLIGILPGFVEEVFYRGLLQRGLLLRWGPVASILTSGLLFAAGHGSLTWAAAVFPLGLWFGVIAWRTGSVLLNFAAHASLNGGWTAAMMVAHRDPASEPVLNWIAIVVLASSVIALPWAIAILRRQPGTATSVEQPLPRPLLPRVAAAAGVAGVVLFAVVPPGVAPKAPEKAASRPVATLAEFEASAADTATCTAVGDAGAVEFSLMPGAGTRVALPENQAGIDEMIVAIDSSSELVWLVYAGERTGKGYNGLPPGVVEQLASDHPTLLCMSLTPGPPPVTVRLTLEEDEAAILAAWEHAAANGWARRGR